MGSGSKGSQAPGPPHASWPRPMTASARLVLCSVSLVNYKGMEQDVLFDDPSYQRLPHKIQASTRDDDDYEDPSELLDSSQQRVPHPVSAGPPPRSPPPLLPPVVKRMTQAGLRVILTLTKP